MVRNLVHASLIGAAALLATLPANASVYNFMGTFGTSAVDFAIVTSNTINPASGAYDITGVSGSVSGYGTVSTYSGVWGTNGDVVSSGLYLNPNQSTGGLFTVQNPPGSGGANLTIDNQFTTSAPHLTGNGFAFLLTDGLTGGLWGNSPGNYGFFLGNYNIFVTSAAATITATPLPTTWTMLLIGLIGLGFASYRSKRTRSACIAAV